MPFISLPSFKATVKISAANTKMNGKRDFPVERTTGEEHFSNCAHYVLWKNMLLAEVNAAHYFIFKILQF